MNIIVLFMNNLCSQVTSSIKNAKVSKSELASKNAANTVYSCCMDAKIDNSIICEKLLQF